MGHVLLPTNCIFNAFTSIKQENEEPVLLLQSEEVTTDSNIGEASSEQQEIITFQDVGVADSLDMGSYMTSVFNGESDNTAGLDKYLSRPVRIQTYTWTEGVTLEENFEPWFDFFNNSTIKRKLDNYARLRCTLKLKFVINSSPFYYGALRACYLPMDHPLTITAPADLVNSSQTPGVFLEPSKMSTVEMELPFLWTGSWLNVRNANQFRDMGRLRLRQFWPLSSANGVAGTGITVNVYAWAEKVELAAPSTQLALQSDEYADRGYGTISGPATAVAGAANILSSIPFIGTFAKATSMGATAVANIAKLFGYSNPPVIDDVHGFHPKSFHAFANVETRMPIDKLCFDPKNEVTIDNSVCDVDPVDSLSYDNTILRESFMNSAIWEGSDTPDTPIMTGCVGCGFERSTVLTSQTLRTYTPLSYFAKMFRLWRGSMIYKFKFVKTKYHKGRVLIAWEPNWDISGLSGIETAIFTRIVDLEYEDEVEIEIPYKAATPYLRIGFKDEIDPTNAGSIPFDLNENNGSFQMRVLNVLTGPTTNPDVGVLLFARPGKDFRFARPTAINLTSTTLPVQSSEIDIAHTNPTADSAIDLITVGETLVSLRPILHRTSLGGVQYFGQNRTSASTYPVAGTQFTTNILTRVPKPYGFDSNRGLSWAQSIITPANEVKINYVPPHPIRWTLECFVGYRGSTNLHINPIVNGIDIQYIDSLAASRYYETEIVNSTNQNVNRFTVTAAANSDSNMARAVSGVSGIVPRKISGQSGMTLTNTNTQSALSFNIPQYIWTRFNRAPYAVATTTHDTGVSIHDNVILTAMFQTATPASATTQWPCFEYYYSAGVDFNPVFFVCVPRIYEYVLPTANDDYTP